MEAFFDNLLNLVCGLISGFILFQSAIVAPTIFQTLPENQAGPFLRSLFPRLFKLCAALMGLNALIAIYFDDLVSTCGFILGVFLMIFLRSTAGTQRYFHSIFLRFFVSHLQRKNLRYTMMLLKEALNESLHKL